MHIFMKMFDQEKWGVIWLFKETCGRQVDLVYFSVFTKRHYWPEVAFFKVIQEGLW